MLFMINGMNITLIINTFATGIFFWRIHIVTQLCFRTSGSMKIFFYFVQNVINVINNFDIIRNCDLVRCVVYYKNIKKRNLLY